MPNDLDNPRNIIMPTTANTHSLSDYKQISINSFHDHISTSQPDRLAFSYSHRDKSYSYNVELLKTHCNYGGYRYWFACPECSRRVGVLYCAGLYVCRHCIGANYQTQLMQPWQRPDARIQAIRKRLGWRYSMYQPKPKGMHRATHKRLFMEYIEIEDSYIRRIEIIDKLVKAKSHS